MHITKNANIMGKKGGSSSPHTPYEQPDDLLSVAKLKMLLAVCEGEVDGEITPQQIYLNDTPLANDDGSYNFTGIKWEFRRGTQDQDYIQGMPEVNNEFSVGQAVTDKSSWTRQFTEPSLDAVRIKLSLPLQYRYENNGDMVGTSTKYAIDLSVDGGSYKTVVDGSFTGKTTSEYQRDHRIDLPKGAEVSAIRVRRITADSTDTKLVNGFKVFSFAEVIDSKLRYPMTCLLYIEADSSQFTQGAPKVTVRMKGKKIRVPDNYDPVSRTYSGAWSGNFKMAYSSNPAWVFYDLLLDKIYGMGNRVTSDMVDKWGLYQIAAYCDEKVSDGAGGTEPRFTCNAYIQSQEEAFVVMQDFAAIFRGMAYWGNSQIVVNADVPADDVDWIYTAANVSDGLFNYAGGSYKNRYTSCLVSYSDPANHYTDTVEAVYDADLVKRYDVQQMSLSAIGCTSQSEAHRRGRWALLSNAKDGSVSFDVGLDGHIPLPASIIGVADPYRSGKDNGGRISAVNGLNITLDRAIDFGVSDRLIINLPDGSAQTRTISSISEDKRTVSVSAAYKVPPVPGAVWIIDSDNLAVQQFRVTSVSDNGNGLFTVAGVQHDPDKYRYIDDGIRIQPPPITVTPTSIVASPKNILISENSHVVQGVSVTSLQVSWDRVDGAVNYSAQWRRDDSNWVSMPVMSSAGFEVPNIYTGRYLVRVMATNPAGISSPWGYSSEVQLTGKTGNPPKPVGLIASENVVLGIELNWGFPANTADTLKTEIQYSATGKNDEAMLLADVPYPQRKYQQMGLKAGQVFWYRAQLVDRTGNQSGYTDWIRGVASADASDILGYLKGQITETHLGKELLDNLNAIDNNLEALGKSALEAQLQIADNRKQLDEKSAKLSTRIDDVRADLSDAEERLQDDIDTLGDKAERNAADINDTRHALSQSEQRLQVNIDAVDSAIAKNVTDIEAINRATLETQLQIVDTRKQLNESSEKLNTSVVEVQKHLDQAASELQDKVDAITGGSDKDIATVISQIAILDEGQKKQASELTAVVAQTDGNAAAIQGEESARIDGDSALGKRIDVVKASTDETAAKIITLTEAQSDAASSQASVSQSLEAVSRAIIEGGLKQEGDSQAQREVSARLTTSQKVLADDQHALAQQVTQIDTKYGNATAQLQEDTLTLSKTGEALTQQFTSLDSKVDQNAATARDQTQAVATELAAEVKRVNELSSQTAGNTAAIQQEVTARTDAENAIGKRIDGIATSAGDNAAALTEIRESQADLAKAQASVTQSLEAVNRAQIEGSLKQAGDVQEQREVSARIITQQEVFTTDLDAQTRRLTQMDSQFGESTARLQEETKTLASDGKALSERIGAVDTKVDDNAASAREQTQAVADALSAEAKRISGLSADVDGVKSDIQAEQKARTDGDKALAESLNVVKTATEKTDAKVSTLEQAQSSLESAQASTTQSLEAINRAQIESDLKREDDVQAQREVSAKLTTQQTVLADTQQAQARQLTQFDAKYGDVTARLQEETETLAKADEALSQRFTSLDAKVDDNAAAAREQTQAVATDLAAESQRVSELSAVTESNKAGIQAEQKARTDGDKSLAESIGVVKTATEQADAKIVNLEEAQSTLESAQASTSQSLEVSFSKATLSDDALARAQLEQALKQTEDDKTQRQVSAKITASQQVTADELKAQGERISGIDTKYGDATAKLAQQDQVLSEQNRATVEQLQVLSATVGDNAAKATQETRVVSDALGAEVKRVDDLATTVGKNTAGIQSEAKARADADSAITQTVTGLSSRTEDAESAITGIQKTQSDTTKALTETQQSLSATKKDVEGQAQSIARVDNAQKATADDVSALSQNLSLVSSEVGEVKASAQQSMTAITDINEKMSASYTMGVEVDNKGNKIVASIGLGVDGEGNSDFIVNANRFSVMVPGGTPQLAFAVINGQTVIREGLIGNASITSAKISDLQSDDYVEGKSGWALPKNGGLEINGNNGAVKIDGDGIHVNVPGVVKIDIGVW